MFPAKFALKSIQSVLFSSLSYQQVAELRHKIAESLRKVEISLFNVLGWQLFSFLCMQVTELIQFQSSADAALSLNQLRLYPLITNHYFAAVIFSLCHKADPKHIVYINLGHFNTKLHQTFSGRMTIQVRRKR